MTLTLDDGTVLELTHINTKRFMLVAKNPVSGMEDMLYEEETQEIGEGFKQLHYKSILINGRYYAFKTKSQ